MVIDNEADFDWAESEANKINPTIPKYLQPQWENSDSKDLIFQYIVKLKLICKLINYNFRNVK